MHPTKISEMWLKSFQFTDIEAGKCLHTILWAIWISGFWDIKFTNPKFTPTWSCIALPWPKLQVGVNYAYLFNLRANIGKYGCISTHFILNNCDSTLSAQGPSLYIRIYVRFWRIKTVRPPTEKFKICIRARNLTHFPLVQSDNRLKID